MKKRLLLFALLAVIVTAGTAMLSVSDETEQVSEASQVEWVSITFDTALATTWCEGGTGGTCCPGPDGQICQSMPEQCNCTCGGTGSDGQGGGDKPTQNN